MWHSSVRQTAGRGGKSVGRSLTCTWEPRPRQPFRLLPQAKIRPSASTEYGGVYTYVMRERERERSFVLHGNLCLFACVSEGGEEEEEEEGEGGVSAPRALPHFAKR